MIRPFRLRGTIIAASLFSILLAGGANFRGARAETSSEPWVLIGLGDSLTHGTMDAKNNTINTLNAYLERTARLLSQAVGLLFTQPLLDDNGARVTPFDVPTNVAIDGEDSFSIDGLNYYRKAGTPTSLPSSSLTADKLLPAFFEDMHDAVLYPINILAKKPVTQMSAAEHLLKNGIPDAGRNRAIIVYWLGNNDSSTSALGFGGSNPTFFPLPVNELKPVMPGISALLTLAQSKGVLSTDSYTMGTIDRNLTLLVDFTTQQSQLLNRLVTASNGLERHIFIQTLPYYSSVGYLMDSEDLEYYFRKLDPLYTVPASFKRVAPPGQPITNPLQGDRISLLTFGLMYALLDTGYSSSYINQVLETNGVQRDGLVLSEAEQQFIISRIDSFNVTLKSLAAGLGPNVHVVDIGGHLNDVLTGKIQLTFGGKQISRKWMRGSSFTFDGVHPAYGGQALIANFLIDHINQALGTNAPKANLETVFATDPYVDWDNDGFAPGPNYPASGMSELLFLFKDPDDANPNIQANIPEEVWEIIARALLREIIGNAPALRADAQRLGLLKSR